MLGKSCWIGGLQSILEKNVLGVATSSLLPSPGVTPPDPPDPSTTSGGFTFLGDLNLNGAWEIRKTDD